MCWLKSLLLCTHAEAREESQRMTRITYEHIFHEIKKNLSGDHCVGRKFLSPKKHRQRRGPFFSGLFSLSHQKRLSELKELVTAENGRKNRLKQRHKFSSWCTREKSKRENFIFLSKQASRAASPRTCFSLCFFLYFTWSHIKTSSLFCTQLSLFHKHFASAGMRKQQQQHFHRTAAF